MKKWRNQLSGEGEEEAQIVKKRNEVKYYQPSLYDLPFCGREIYDQPCTHYIPVCSSYQPVPLCKTNCKKRNREDKEQEEVITRL